MAISTLDQFHLFLLALAGGAFAGLFFDLFRAIRRLVQSGAIWVGVQDLIFWLFSAISVFLFLYHFNAGQLRWYIFCGMGLGGLFYHLLFGDRLVRLLTAFFRLISRLVCYLFRLLSFPFLLLWRIFRPFFQFFGRIFTVLRRKFIFFWVQQMKSAKKIKKRLKMY